MYLERLLVHAKDVLPAGPEDRGGTLPLPRFGPGQILGHLGQSSIAAMGAALLAASIAASCGLGRVVVCGRLRGLSRGAGRAVARPQRGVEPPFKASVARRRAQGVHHCPLLPLREGLYDSSAHTLDLALVRLLHPALGARWSQPYSVQKTTK